MSEFRQKNRSFLQKISQKLIFLTEIYPALRKTPPISERFGR